MLERRLLELEARLAGNADMHGAVRTTGSQLSAVNAAPCTGPGSSPEGAGDAPGAEGRGAADEAELAECLVVAPVLSFDVGMASGGQTCREEDEGGSSRCVEGAEQGHEGPGGSGEIRPEVDSEMDPSAQRRIGDTSSREEAELPAQQNESVSSREEVKDVGMESDELSEALKNAGWAMPCGEGSLRERESRLERELAEAKEREACLETQLAEAKERETHLERELVEAKSRCVRQGRRSRTAA